MKKKKTTFKKLTLHKNVISKLEKGQVNGGSPVSLVIVCTNPTAWNCPPQTILCPPQTLNCPPGTRFCPQTLDCPIDSLACPSFNGGGCGSIVDACPTWGCPF